MPNVKQHTLLQLFHMALGRIGAAKTIIAFTDNTAEAKIGSLVYRGAIERVLHDFKWSFATKFAALVPVVSPPVTMLGGWGYAYQYPADCLYARAISGDERIPYRIVSDEAGTGSVILCNIPDATLEYTFIPAGIEDATLGPAGDAGLP
jgi:hypothetical protein